MSTEDTPAGSSAEIGALLRARQPLLWVVTSEEVRVERAIVEAAGAVGYGARLWDCVTGLTDATGKDNPGRNMADPDTALAELGKSAVREVWIFRDLPAWLKSPVTCRAVRSLARKLPSEKRENGRAIVVLSPSAEVPPELADCAVVVKWALPDRAEIGRIFDAAISPLKPAAKEAAAAVREAAIEAAVGLSAEAIATCYSKSLVTQDAQIVPSLVAAEKRRVVNREKGIEWFDPDPRGLSAVGGLELLKPWLAARRGAFSQEARDFGLPLPKGMLLVGVPGCGKSLTAKAVAAAWGVPLLRADLGGMQSKWVGESQGNIRAAFAIAETVGNCVLWIDEIEKALAGATSGAADGGVSSDALGTLLSWMQERKGSVFVIATANDVSKLPPELLRKGRFDELFFVDLPTLREREEILRVTLRQYKRDAEGIDVRTVAAACGDFTGSEIAAIVPDALFQAFADGKRAIRTADLIAAAGTVAPLAKTASEKINALREWAKGRARLASAPEEKSSTTGGGRDLDV